MKLYDVATSSNCRRVRIAAAELGLPLEIVPVNPMAGENKTPEYLAKNPMGKVPTLDDDGFVLFESGAILVYLARKAPGAGLLPSDPRGEAEVLRWMFFNQSHIAPHASTINVERWHKPQRGGTPDEAIVAAAQRELDRFLPVVEEQLGRGEFVAGRYSLADIVMGCSFSIFARGRISLDAYPRIRAWLERLQAREAWVKTRPA